VNDPNNEHHTDPSSEPLSPTTLCIDIGGTGLKASVLDAAGTMLTDRVRVPVRYPMSPRDLLDRLSAMVAPLPAHDRVSAGFPGVVRHGKLLTAPHFVTVSGPGSKVDKHLSKQWADFALAAELAKCFGAPARIINDADLQGLDATSGQGLEMVVTLGTGVGTSLLEGGVLGPHLELAHHRFRRGESYDQQLGNAARKAIGNRAWNGRVAKAIKAFDALVRFDVLYIGGGNSRHIDPDVLAALGPKVKLIDPNAGILGGVKLWGQPER
jgi:polyphosphate glucokinase